MAILWQRNDPVREHDAITGQLFSWLISILLIILILYLALVIGMQTDENSWFNRNLRTKLVNRYEWRPWLFADQPGDATADYLQNEPLNTLVIELDALQGYALTAEARANLADLLQRYVQKPRGVTVQESDMSIPEKFVDNYSHDKEIEGLLHQYRSVKTGDGKAVLHLMLSSKSLDNPDMVGEVYDATTMVLYLDTIKALTATTGLRATLEQAIFLHEFGHLIGLEHSADPDSVMLESIEVPQSRLSYASIPTRFSEREYKYIQQSKAFYSTQSR